MSPLEFKRCEQKSGENQPHADTVVDFIQTDTKPSDFDQKINTLAGYKLQFGNFLGSNALGTAASKGNVSLVSHIVTLDPTLVNLGNGPGWTPLMCASGNCADPVAAVKAAKALLKANANVNLTSTDAQAMDDGLVWGDGTTPLHLALFNGNFALVKLLLKNGALTATSVDEKGINTIQKANAELEIEDQRRIIFQAGARVLRTLKGERSILSCLPADVRKIIFSYVKAD